MKTIITVLILLLVIGGIVLWGMEKNPDAVTTRVELTGADGLQVTGSYTADGQAYKVDEVLPAEITITAKKLSLLMESSEESESIFAKVFLDDKLSVSGGQRRIKIEVSGKTPLSTPSAHLTAF